MKIKTDFVTNSSSVSYVVFVPKDLTFKKEELKEYVEEEWPGEFEFTPLSEIVEEVEEILKSLSERNQIYEEDESHAAYSFVLSLLEDNDLVIGSLETGSSGASSIAGVSEDAIEKCFLAINKDRIKEICKP